jgi:hypothetical protein
MSNVDNKNSISIKFTGKNFMVWKPAAIGSFKSKGLYDIIDPKIKINIIPQIPDQPDDQKSNDQKEDTTTLNFTHTKYDKFSARIYTIIYNSFSEQMMYTIMLTFYLLANWRITKN